LLALELPSFSKERVAASGPHVTAEGWGVFRIEDEGLRIEDLAGGLSSSIILNPQFSILNPASPPAVTKAAATLSQKLSGR
jgi:hypothetical protein